MEDESAHMVPFFLKGCQGSLFCVLLKPTSLPVRGGILYLHPFAEEMHKSRRMVAVQARHLAEAGWAVLQVDLSGCGDSVGDFSDASWTAWRDDAGRAWAQLLDMFPGCPHYLWGLRLGGTLAAQVSADLADVSGLMLWHPVTAGNLFLNQFLRIRLAGEMLAEGKAQTDTQSLLSRLKQGEVIEVGGYGLSGQMAQELADVRLSDIRPACVVAWLEVGAQGGEDISPAGRRVVEAWQQSGVEVSRQTLRGDPFWITQEITECSELLPATQAALERMERRDIAS